VKESKEDAAVEMQICDLYGQKNPGAEPGFFCDQLSAA